MKEKKAITLKTLTKSNVWDIQENDVFRMWTAAEKDVDLKDYARKYLDIIRSAFEVEEVKIDKPEIIKKYEARGLKVRTIRMDENTKQKIAIKKKPISRVTDLTYENIRHITATKLIEVLERNFGGGWDSLPQSIQDIIQSGFDISTTTLPKDRMHMPGGLYEKKVNDGYEVLEIPKGLWIEAIFAKEKPHVEVLKSRMSSLDDLTRGGDLDDDDDENMDLPLDDFKHDEDEDDDSFDDDKLTEESYRTTYETDPEDLISEAEDISDDEY